LLLLRKFILEHFGTAV